MAGPSLLFRALAAVCMAALVGIPAPATAGDPSAFAKGVSELPPAEQLDIVRIILNDTVGTPDEIRAHFAAACNKRQQPAAAPAPAPAGKDAQPFASMLRSKIAGLSSEASLAALCAAPIRPKVDGALAIEGRIASKRAAEDAAFARADKAKAANGAKPD